MKTASIALTRACVIGGDWNGVCVEGYNEFRDSETYRDFDTFAGLFRILVKEFPYVHYDDEPGHVVLVHDDSNGNVVAGQGLEVLRLETPDDGTLLAWYDELKPAMEG